MLLSGGTMFNPCWGRQFFSLKNIHIIIIKISYCCGMRSNKNLQIKQITVKNEKKEFKIKKMQQQLQQQ